MQPPSEEVSVNRQHRPQPISRRIRRLFLWVFLGLVLYYAFTRLGFVLFPEAELLVKRVVKFGMGIVMLSGILYIYWYSRRGQKRSAKPRDIPDDNPKDTP